MQSIYTQIEINAPIEKVWEHLIDFASYPTWNPVLTKMTAPAKLGGKGMLTVKASALPLILPIKIKTFNHSGDVYELSWVGAVPKVMGLLVDATHSFVINRIDDHTCLFVNKEDFTGILSGIVAPLKNTITQQYNDSNIAFKQRVEQV